MSATDAAMIEHARRRGRRLAERLPPPEFVRSDYGAGFDAGISNIDPVLDASREFMRGWFDGQAVFQQSIARRA